MEEQLKSLTESQKAKISILIDKANDVLHQTESKLNTVLEVHSEKIKRESDNFIEDCNLKKKKLFRNVSLIQYLVFFDLAILPIVVAVIAYKIFIK
ncbi:hypothetical protein [Clostridium beijerinckii]|uniref:hypothetical protein n=1 Tax=Clostridium beijerinckii TaxID=1520 RepID=UPI001494B014|nr:hypothetical protein [Clostridium beijerinckii]MBC2460401.1 hypothetical protein [Clostridium beijerinckii]NOW35459.1 putative RNA-binding protein [Clostridium beijerinckii]